MYGADAALSVTRKRESSTPQRRRGVKGSSAFERVKKFQPHPEERPKGASRRMAASHCRASILRDAVLRTAPQDEVVVTRQRGMRACLLMARALHIAVECCAGMSAL